MGWSRGSLVMAETIKAVKKHPIPNVVRRAIYADLAEVLEDMDCDTLFECRGQDPAFDVWLNERYPQDD